jgi:hypothetical protein
MAGYLSDPDGALTLSGAFAPPESEIQTVVAFLSVCPVVGYLGFSEAEVRVIGAYRVRFSSAIHPAEPWRLMLAGEPFGWIMAVHEAVEVEAFLYKGLNPFDRTAWIANYHEPHRQATVRELDFAMTWAVQEGLNTSRVALYLENPILRQTLLPHVHRAAVTSLRQQMGWNEPTASELTEAREFWRRMLVTP